MTATIHDDESVGVKLSTLIVETQKIDNIETPLHQQRKLMASPAIAVRYVKLQVTAAEYAMVGFAQASTSTVSITQQKLCSSVLRL